MLEMTVRRSDEIVWKPGDDSVILLDPRDGEYYTLDDVAMRVWSLCDGARPVGDVVAALAEEYEAPVEEIRADVLELVRELLDERLLQTG